MTTMAGSRKTVSIHDYPEHLNPFREEDNHHKIRFWTIGRRLSRSNSITFSGIKDLKNSWSLRSFMRKGKKGEQATLQDSKKNQVNGGNSPVVFRRALQYSSTSGARSTVGSPERADRYVYGGSVTPLPRSRFQERLRSSQQEINSLSPTPRMARSDIMGSRLSVESTNPFDEAPIPPVRASRRKKKRAPPPPTTSTADDSMNSENLELRITETDDSKHSNNVDDDIEEMNLKVELKIVEDEEKNITLIEPEKTKVPDKVDENHQIVAGEETKELNSINSIETKLEETAENRSKSKEDILEQVSFPKVDILKYRRNSSVNEDDIKLRRGNLEDFHTLSNKRSKSLTNTFDGSYVAYDVNLNQSTCFDINSNEEPQKVVCKVYDDSRKESIDISISSTEKDFLEIDKATRELEKEINKLNSALIEDDFNFDNNNRLSVSEIRQKFDRSDASSPNPIPKPRRSHYGEPSTVNGNI
ncbi:uncharacterized protein LOC126771695 isoform X1 [Nymphalis io]|uniref:uncharacterized protein LOC126771695 isoform X1 n=2 Tax=Inachis io TaxID=171585 RepID=UPI002169D67E|nr:uncharacterized protein LOC126771695 isoform X1 [Nymphalis io]